jgi:hypothetical protein
VYYLDAMTFGTRSACVTVATGFLLLCCGGTTVPTSGNQDGGGVGGGDATNADAAIGLDGSSGAAACSGPGTCILRSTSCCACGTPTLADFVAVPSDQIAAYDKTHCNPAPPCPPCMTQPQPFVLGAFQAICRSSQCIVVDMRTEPVSACDLDTDCVFRGSDCCECGSKGFIALNKAQATQYMNEVCPPQGACPLCLPAPPSGVRPACDPTTKHGVAVPTDGG